MWYIKGDYSEPVITAEKHIDSEHADSRLKLPETAIVFFMHSGVEILSKKFNAKKYPENFPRFLSSCPIWELDGENICFLNGGSGSPMACDTIETLAVLGVKNIVSIGMFGVFDPKVKPGEIIAPEMTYVEEGTSLHYYESIEYSEPDEGLLNAVKKILGVRSFPTVTTDAVYRQTFNKEQLWREQDAVGVDMEASAVFSVSRYVGIRAVSLLIASDMHPLRPCDNEWHWKMTNRMREEIVEKSYYFASQLSNLKF